MDEISFPLQNAFLPWRTLTRLYTPGQFSVNMAGRPKECSHHRSACLPSLWTGLSLLGNPQCRQSGAHKKVGFRREGLLLKGPLGGGWEEDVRGQLYSGSPSKAGLGPTAAKSHDSVGVWHWAAAPRTPSLLRT